MSRSERAEPDWEQQERERLAALPTAQQGEPLDVVIGKTPIVVEYSREREDDELIPSSVTLANGRSFTIEHCRRRGLLLWQHESRGKPWRYEVRAALRRGPVAPEAERWPIYIAPGVQLVRNGRRIDRSLLPRLEYSEVTELPSDPFEGSDEGNVDYCYECDDFYPTDGDQCEHMNFRWDHSQDPSTLDEVYVRRDARYDAPFVGVVLAKTPPCFGDRPGDAVSYRYLGTGRRAKLSLKAFCARWEQMSYTGYLEVGFEEIDEHACCQTGLLLRKTDTELVVQYEGKLFRFDRATGRCGMKRLTWGELAEHGLFAVPLEDVVFEDLRQYEHRGRIGQLLGGDWMLDAARGSNYCEIAPFPNRDAAEARLWAMYRAWL